MSASILNGKLVAFELGKTLQHDVANFKQKMHRPPGLAVILVGDDPASFIYVNSKRNACLAQGFESFYYHFSAKASENELLSLIDRLNEKNDVDGILVQLPLPSHMKTETIIKRIKPTKDVDGFHPYNLGRLVQGNPVLRPCTSLGVINLLKFYHIPLLGQHAVVVGASNIVGRPMALEFLLEKATVTICHRSTINLESHVRMADIVVSAAGSLDVINPEWLHKKQVIIDIGIHRLQDGSLRGDINFNAAKDKVAWITPVPGGVGPMTICMLLHNTLSAALTNLAYQIMLTK